MDAVKFWKEFQRMCSYYYNGPSSADCHKCPFFELCDMNILIEMDAEEIVSVLEKWVAKNPPKTNAEKFEEVFGVKINNNKNLDKDGRAFTIETGFPGRLWNQKWLEEPYEEITKKGNGVILDER